MEDNFSTDGRGESGGNGSESLLSCSPPAVWPGSSTGLWPSGWAPLLLDTQIKYYFPQFIKDHNSNSRNLSSAYYKTGIVLILCMHYSL